ncbi:BDR-repeat family protein [Micractinium conductrix]|uniref:BDR-repeat family protein n=1 Tax=Micractinium conductrix TaxID=554055 RepID=A0A2P6V405_9CHLO|nr:BDR-repeat family protein [Micractinium conductrix]|eukprot:PSC68816.1 BDR-repeat family protein [Micractinium conductrix]
MFGRLFRSGVADPGAAGARAFSALTAAAGPTPAAPRYDLRTLVMVTFGIAAAAAALVTGGWAAVTHLDAKIDATTKDTTNKIDNKIDATNNKIDALGADVRSSFSALREDMCRRDNKLEQMRGTTRVLEGNVGRLMDAALGRQQQQQRREPPPSAGNEAMFARLFRSGVADPGAAGARAFSTLTAAAGPTPAAPRYDLRTLVLVTFGIAAAAAALVTGGWAAVTHLDAKIDATTKDTTNKIDNKIDATNNKIDALGADVRSSFSALRDYMCRRDNKLEQMRGTTRVLEGNVGRLMDAALGRQQQQQRREPPPSAGNEAMFARLFRSGVADPGAAGARAFSALTAAAGPTPAAPRYDLRTLVLVTFGIAAAAAALVTGGWAAVTHLDAKIDATTKDTTNKIDNKIDATNNKIDALGADVRSSFSALRDYMCRRDNKLEQMRGTTRVLEGNVGRLMDAALGRQQQQQRREPPPSAGNEAMFARLFRSGVADPGAAGARAFSALTAAAGPTPAAPRYDLRTVVQVTFGIAAAAAALVTGGLAAVTHLDAKIDATTKDTNNKIDNKIDTTNNKIDNKIDATNNKIDALGADVRSSFSALREDMRRRDNKLEQMRGTTRVLEGDVGRLMDAALGRQQQQQRREPPPSAGDG